MGSPAQNLRCDRCEKVIYSDETAVVIETGATWYNGGLPLHAIYHEDCHEEMEGVTRLSDF